MRVICHHDNTFDGIVATVRVSSRNHVDPETGQAWMPRSRMGKGVRVTAGNQSQYRSVIRLANAISP